MALPDIELGKGHRQKILGRLRGLTTCSNVPSLRSPRFSRFSRLGPGLRRAVEAGIDVVIFSFTTLPPDTGRHFSYGIAEHQLEKYWSHKVIMIADTTRALIGGAEETEDNRVVVTEEMALVEMALSNLVLDITLFGQRHDVDTAEVVSHLTVHLAPVEDLVASSLK